MLHKHVLFCDPLAGKLRGSAHAATAAAGPSESDGRLDHGQCHSNHDRVILLCIRAVDAFLLLNCVLTASTMSDDDPCVPATETPSASPAGGVADPDTARE